MEILNLTVENVTFVQTGRGGGNVTARLPSGALMRFQPAGQNPYRVSVAETSCQSRPFNDPDALLVIESVDPCTIKIYRLASPEEA